MEEKMNNKKIIAFYLPQYHTIPENDKYWGKGFTEWVNTKKAQPLFEGHYQPKTPLNENYYNLLDPEVMRYQAKLAKENGVYGFCYYHYWFKDGKKLLEKPIENMLKDKNVDIPFCLCWANENWTKRWDGGKNEVIIEQNYGSKKEWSKHFDYFLEFFKDERYIKIDNKPILLIYKPQLIPKVGRMIKYFKRLAINNGFDGLIIMNQHPSWIIDKKYNKNLFDYIIKFEPFFTYTIINRNLNLNKYSFYNKFWNVMNEYGLFIKCIGFVKKIRNKFNKNKSDNNELQIKDYDEYWNFIINKSPTNDNLISGAFTDWDNTARRKNGMLFKGANPQKFEKYFSELVKKDSVLDLIFINAWNEWAEGAYLEPDERYKYAYLDAIRKSLKEEK